MSKRTRRKTLLNEKLPDPQSAAADSTGDPRGRTMAHLRRILTASLSLPLAAGVTSCSVTGYQVVDPAPPPAILPRAFGTVKLKSPMLVSINGQTTQSMVAGGEVSLGMGIHTIQLTALSNVSAFSVEIRIEGSPPRGAAGPQASGVLKTVTSANIQVDGKPATRVTPQDSVELAAGGHTLEISPLQASQTHTFTLEIRTGTASPQTRGQ